MIKICLRRLRTGHANGRHDVMTAVVIGAATVATSAVCGVHDNCDVADGNYLETHEDPNGARGLNRLWIMLWVRS